MTHGVNALGTAEGLNIFRKTDSVEKSENFSVAFLSAIFYFDSLFSDWYFFIWMTFFWVAYLWYFSRTYMIFLRDQIFFKWHVPQTRWFWSNFLNRTLIDKAWYWLLYTAKKNQKLLPELNSKWSSNSFSGSLKNIAKYFYFTRNNSITRYNFIWVILYKKKTMGFFHYFFMV